MWVIVLADGGKYLSPVIPVEWSCLEWACYGLTEATLAVIFFHGVRWHFSTAFTYYQDINIFPLTRPFCSSLLSCAYSGVNFLPSTTLLGSFYFRTQDICLCFDNWELLRTQKCATSYHPLFPKALQTLLHSWDIWKMCTSAYEASGNIRLKLTLPISCLFGSLRIWAPRSPTMHRWLCFSKSCLELGSPTFYRCSHCSPWTLLLPLRLPWWLTWLAGEELMFGSYVQITLHQAVLLSWELGLTAAIALLVCFLMHLYLCGTDREQQNQLMLSRNHFLHVRTVSGVALLY